MKDCPDSPLVEAVASRRGVIWLAHLGMYEDFYLSLAQMKTFAMSTTFQLVSLPWTLDFFFFFKMFCR